MVWGPTCAGAASRAAMSGEAGGDDSTSTSSPAHSKSEENTVGTGFSQTYQREMAFESIL